MRAANPTLTVAPLHLRIGAALIDAVILLVINAALVAAANPDSLGESSTANETSYAIALISGAVYYIGFNAIVSATPGKIAMRIYVADRQGARVRPDTAILRFIVFLVGSIFLFGIGALISIVLVIVDPNRRSLHDRIAGTLVLRRPSDSEVPPPDLS
jgi:uncharacterized RDD family membrane protein YckC